MYLKLKSKRSYQVVILGCSSQSGKMLYVEVKKDICKAPIACFFFTFLGGQLFHFSLKVHSSCQPSLARKIRKKKFFLNKRRQNVLNFLLPFVFFCFFLSPLFFSPVLLPPSCPPPFQPFFLFFNNGRWGKKKKKGHDR